MFYAYNDCRPCWASYFLQRNDYQDVYLEAFPASGMALPSMRKSASPRVAVYDPDRIWSRYLTSEFFYEAQSGYYYKPESF